MHLLVVKDLVIPNSILTSYTGHWRQERNQKSAPPLLLWPVLGVFNACEHFVWLLFCLYVACLGMVCSLARTALAQANTTNSVLNHAR